MRWCTVTSFTLLPFCPGATLRDRTSLARQFSASKHSNAMSRSKYQLARLICNQHLLASWQHLPWCILLFIVEVGASAENWARDKTTKDSYLCYRVIACVVCSIEFWLWTWVSRVEIILQTYSNPPDVDRTYHPRPACHHRISPADPTLLTYLAVYKGVARVLHPILAHPRQRRHCPKLSGTTLEGIIADIDRLRTPRLFWFGLPLLDGLLYFLLHFRHPSFIHFRPLSLTITLVVDLFENASKEKEVNALAYIDLKSVDQKILDNG